MRDLLAGRHVVIRGARELLAVEISDGVRSGSAFGCAVRNRSV